MVQVEVVSALRTAVGPTADWLVTAREELVRAREEVVWAREVVVRALEEVVRALEEVVRALAAEEVARVVCREAKGVGGRRDSSQCRRSLARRSGHN